MIEVKNLSKIYGQVHSIDNISFKTQSNEILGLLGENGAGKTTLLRMISTLIKPTSGDIIINGKSILANKNEIRKDIGILFGGEVGIYDRLTAKENIQYFGRLNGVTKEVLNENIKKISNLLNMDEFLNRKVGSFSRGMKQKVAIARAIIHDPNIILFDEPTIGLDLRTTKIIHKFVMDSKKQGKLVIISSHSIEELEKLCDRILIINKGKIIDIGEISDLKKKYNNYNLYNLFINLIGDKNE